MPANANPSPCMIVIFGASGDLTRRKLVPALYDLYVGKQLPQQFAILGVSRSAMTDDAFRDRLEEMAKQSAHDFKADAWSQFARHLYYHAADSTKEQDYPGLKQRMGELAGAHELGENVLFYLSLAPQLYDRTIVNIGQQGLVIEGKAWCSIDRLHRPWQRIIIEKPFGRDPASAAHLNRVLGRVFEEESIYRIDHYLGKETVQNLLVFRFANAIFEPIWNRSYIDHVQVTAAETVGVEGRGGYYDSDSGGAMRDMIQSHLLQVMALVAMEPPVSMRADDVRTEKNKILTAVRPYGAADIADIAVRGQYGPGKLDGKDAPGYRQEKGVAPDSRTETYAALQLFIDTWRWGGVPFYVRSGKRMARKLTEVVIYFKPTPHRLFRDEVSGAGGASGGDSGGAARLSGPAPQSQRPEITPNQIVINIQPDEGIRLRFEGKVPGLGMKIKSVVMDFDFVEQFKTEPPEAYATLLLDCMRGDQTLFKHRDEIERAWQIVQPTLDHWSQHPDQPPATYASGAWGPKEADDMMARAERHWHNP